MSTLKERTSVFLRSRPFRQSLSVVALLVPAALVPLLPRVIAQMNNNFVQLHVEEGFTIPVTEVSGMAERLSSRREREIFVVGDRDSTLWHGVFTNDNLVKKSLYDMKKPMGFEMSECRENPTPFCRHIYEGLTGQWEGLATDGKGRLWALQETTESIHVFDANLSRRKATIFLPSASQRAPTHLAQARIKGEKMLFEGVLVTSERTFLAAKQSKPATIIKYELSTELTNDANDQQVQAVPSQVWALPAEYADCSLNEISKGDGAVFAVSSNCKVIMELAFEAKSTLTVKNVLHLPSALNKPESLVVLSRDKFLVGDDAAKPGRNNLFLLRPATHLIAYQTSSVAARD